MAGIWKCVYVRVCASLWQPNGQKRGQRKRRQYRPCHHFYCRHLACVRQVVSSFCQKYIYLFVNCKCNVRTVSETSLRSLSALTCQQVRQLGTRLPLAETRFDPISFSCCRLQCKLEFMARKRRARPVFVMLHLITGATESYT